MRAKITKPDGTTVELESVNVDDVVRAVRELALPYSFVPVVAPSIWPADPYPWRPPTITWTTTTVTPEPA